MRKIPVFPSYNKVIECIRKGAALDLKMGIEADLIWTEKGISMSREINSQALMDSTWPEVLLTPIIHVIVY